MKKNVNKLIRAAIPADILGASYLKNCLESQGICYGTEVEVSCFSDHESLYMNILSNVFYDIVFLDVEDNYGLMTAEYIREELLDETTTIIFISSAKELAVKFIRLHPFDCLVKPLNLPMVSECVNRYMKAASRESKFMLFSKNWIRYRIPSLKITFIETVGRTIRIYTIKDLYEFSGRLTEYMKIGVLRNFVEIHNEFMVNPEYVSEVGSGYVVINGRIKLPVSCQYMDNLLAVMARYGLRMKKDSNLNKIKGNIC